MMKEMLTMENLKNIAMFSVTGGLLEFAFTRFSKGKTTNVLKNIDQDTYDSLYTLDEKLRIFKSSELEHRVTSLCFLFDSLYEMEQSQQHKTSINYEANEVLYKIESIMDMLKKSIAVCTIDVLKQDIEETLEELKTTSNDVCYNITQNSKM